MITAVSVERQRVSSSKITGWDPKPGLVGGWDGAVMFLELTRRLSGVRKGWDAIAVWWAWKMRDLVYERIWKPWATHSPFHQSLCCAQFQVLGLQQGTEWVKINPVLILWSLGFEWIIGFLVSNRAVSLVELIEKPKILETIHRQSNSNYKTKEKELNLSYRKRGPAVVLR